MGNCMFKKIGLGAVEEKEMVKVVTSSGGVMELYAPITVDSITNEFPGYGIFRTPTPTPPLPHNEHLSPGQYYYLLPLHHHHMKTTTTILETPYRMSLQEQDNQHQPVLKRISEAAEVFPKYNTNTTGVWKVRLVINPDQLSHILSQEARTEALIHSVRTVAKCGTATALQSSDHAWTNATDD